MRHLERLLTCALVSALGCGAEQHALESDAGAAAREDSGDGSLAGSGVYASEVVAFEAGTSAGFGQGDFPDVVLGPPRGGGTGSGSLDVLSLGVGGSIVLDFGEQGIVDGEGADFVVFENPFWPGGDPARVFAELAEVSVSDDGQTWFTFPCDTKGTGEGEFPGCAGWTPTLMYELSMVPLDPEATGGDAFDLATLSLTSARFIRVRDLSTSGAGSNAGFDLDAIGVVHSGR